MAAARGRRNRRTGQCREGLRAKVAGAWGPARVAIATIAALTMAQAGLAALASPAAAEPRVLEVHIAVTADERGVRQALERIDQRLRTASDGRVSLGLNDVAADQGAAAAAAITRAGLTKGDVPAALLPAATFTRASAMFTAPDIPFLLDTQHRRRQFRDHLTGRLADLLAEHGLRLIGFLEMRPRAVYLRPSLTPAQAIAGRTFGVTDAASRRLAELLRARPVAMKAADVEAAMQRGDIDAALAPLPLGEAATAAAAQPAPSGRGADWPAATAIASWPLALLVARQDALDGMPAGTAAQFHEIANEIANLSDETPGPNGDGVLAGSAPVMLEGSGGNDPLMALLSEAGQRMAEEWRMGAGADGRALLDAIGRNAPRSQDSASPRN